MIPWACFIAWLMQKQRTNDASSVAEIFALLTLVPVLWAVDRSVRHIDCESPNRICHACITNADLDAAILAEGSCGPEPPSPSEHQFISNISLVKSASTSILAGRSPPLA